MTRHDMTRHDMTWLKYVMTWHDMTWLRYDWDMTWHDMTETWLRYDTTRHGTTQHEMIEIWHDMTWHDTMRHDMRWLKYDMTWHDMTWLRYDTTRHDMTRHDMTRHDMTWHKTTWHDTTRRGTARHDMTCDMTEIWYDWVYGTCAVESISYKAWIARTIEATRCVGTCSYWTAAAIVFLTFIDVCTYTGDILHATYTTASVMECNRRLYIQANTQRDTLHSTLQPVEWNVIWWDFGIVGGTLHSQFVL